MIVSSCSLPSSSVSLSPPAGGCAPPAPHTPPHTHQHQHQHQQQQAHTLQQTSRQQLHNEQHQDNKQSAPLPGVRSDDNNVVHDDSSSTFRVTAAAAALSAAPSNPQQPTIAQENQEEDATIQLSNGYVFHKKFGGFQKLTHPVSIRFDHLSLVLPDGRELLHDISGQFKNSKLIAIMGPSGSGKTTFLNVLCGKYENSSLLKGAIYLNEEQNSLFKMKSDVGFVPQDDILHDELTVFENLYFYAMMRLPSDMPLLSKLSIVHTTIRMLGLERIQHQVVGNVEMKSISGGERKRVSIGLEIVSWPTVLFMDEPTSGLDSSACVSVLACLRELTELGLTVITVIHQPRYCVISMFHELMLLGPGGHLVYLGPVTHVIPYFHNLGFELPQNENPCDFCLDVITGVIPRHNDPDFQPSDLFNLWIMYGSAVQAEADQANTNAVQTVEIEAVHTVENELVNDAAAVSTAVSDGTAAPAANNQAASQPNFITPLEAVNKQQVNQTSRATANAKTHVSVFQSSSPIELIRDSGASFGRFNAVSTYRPGCVIAADRRVTMYVPSPDHGVHMLQHHQEHTSDRRPFTFNQNSVESLTRNASISQFGPAQLLRVKPRVPNRSPSPDRSPNDMNEFKSPLSAQSPASHMKADAAAASPVVSPHVPPLVFNSPAHRSQFSSSQQAIESSPLELLGRSSMNLDKEARAQSNASLSVRMIPDRQGTFARALNQLRLNPAQPMSVSHPATPSYAHAPSLLRPASISQPPSVSRINSVLRVLSHRGGGGASSHRNSARGVGVGGLGAASSPYGVSLDTVDSASEQSISNSNSDRKQKRTSRRTKRASKNELTVPTTAPVGKQFSSPFGVDTDGDEGVNESSRLLDLDEAEAMLQTSRPPLLVVPSISQFIVEPQEVRSLHARQPLTMRMLSTGNTQKIAPINNQSKQNNNQPNNQIQSTQQNYQHPDDLAKQMNGVKPIANPSSPSDSTIVEVSSQSHILPTRVLPGFIACYLLFSHRFWVKHIRRWRGYIVDIIQFVFTGCLIGVVYSHSWNLNNYSSMAGMTVVAAGLSSSVLSLGLFSEEKIMFWREYSAGLNPYAYYLSNVINQMPIMFVFSLLFTAGYHSLTSPSTPFWVMMLTYWAVYFCCSGMGIFFSILFDYRQALLFATMFSLLIGGFLNGITTSSYSSMSSFAKGALTMSYSRWAVEVLMMQELKWENVTDSTRLEFETQWGWETYEMDRNIGIIFVIGIVLRLAGLLALRFGRHTQKHA